MVIWQFTNIRGLRSWLSGRAVKHGFGAFSDTCTLRSAKAFNYDDLENNVAVPKLVALTEGIEASLSSLGTVS